MQIRKAPIAQTDEPFLFALYADTRQEELAVVSWSDEQKDAFLKMQFQAQHLHYTTKFPLASLQILRLDNQPIGRLYIAEFDDEIRILDLTITPDFRNKKIGSLLLGEIVQDAQTKDKSIQIYLENYNPAQNLFLRFGFEVVAEEGLYQIWNKSADRKISQGKTMANTHTGS
jgi:ribosomal protein S18 acetylase RimI-like enzyme